MYRAKTKYELAHEDQQLLKILAGGSGAGLLGAGGYSVMQDR